jgi:hypothetical protein
MGKPSKATIPQAPTVREAAGVLRPLFAKRLRFIATITGPHTVRTQVLAACAIEAMAEWEIVQREIALLGPDAGAAHMLKRELADAIEFGAPLDMFAEERADGLVEVAYAHSGQFERVRWQHRAQFLGEFLSLLKRAAGLEPGGKTDKILARRRRELWTALAFEERTRVRGDELSAAHAAAVAREESLPALSMLLEMSERWGEHRRRARVFDDADILAGVLYPERDCPLVLVDEAHEIGPLGQAAIKTMFPRAVMIAAGEAGAGMLARLQADAALELE